MNDFSVFFEKVKREILYLCNAKVVVLWGYGSGGWFVEHLFKRSGRNIEYIIDNNIATRAYDPYFLKRLNPKTTMVLISFSRDEKTSSYLDGLGYTENVGYIYVKDFFGLSDRKKVFHMVISLKTNLESILQIHRILIFRQIVIFILLRPV